MMVKIKKLKRYQPLELIYGGERGIRTLDTD